MTEITVSGVTGAVICGCVVGTWIFIEILQVKCVCETIYDGSSEALWILMPWCCSTRASVATVLITHPCIPSCYLYVEIMPACLTPIISFSWNRIFSLTLNPTFCVCAPMCVACNLVMAIRQSSIGISQGWSCCGNLSPANRLDIWVREQWICWWLCLDCFVLVYLYSSTLKVILLIFLLRSL